MASGIVITSVHDALAVAARIIESATEEVVWLIPPSLLSLSLPYGFIERTRTFIDQGGVSRGVVPTSRANVAEIQTSLAVGKHIRHSDAAHELYMFIGDRRASISAVNMGVKEFTLATPVVAFWSEDPEYAAYLLTSFEGAWAEAEPADKRIVTLLA